MVALSDLGSHPQGVVTTIAAKCRRCYNCVRSCPAKAIRVQSGQAYVMEERCIGCGNCIRVCAQGAKQVVPHEPAVSHMLADATPTIAILAPSYPAAYEDIGGGQLVSAVRALGFDEVLEVGFGAEMVANAYAGLLRRTPDRPVISTPCPALVSYIEKYMPGLVPNLAPVVSPMIAMGRAVKEEFSPGAHVVFIGPCIAKKAELRDPPVAGAVDAALTFIELDAMLQQAGIQPASLDPEAADEPLPHFGALFPVSGGLLKAASIRADLMDDSIVVVEGPDRCIAALNDLQEGRFSARFLDALLCEGCIAGPGFSSDMSPLARKERVTEHVRALEPHARASRRAMRRVARIDLSRTFSPHTVPSALPTETELRDILAATNKFGPADELNCGACGYPTCREKAIAVHQGLAEPEMCLPYLIDQLEVNLQKLSRSKDEIDKARELASRARQLASMGQLASDIAQQIAKPLGNVVVYTQLVRDGMQEDDARREDLASVIAEGLHCREILTGLRGFAKQMEPQWQQTQVRTVLDRAVGECAPRLQQAGISLSVDLCGEAPQIVADPEQLAQVIVNILTNSLEALDGSGRICVTSQLSTDGDFLELAIADDGPGIDEAMIPNIFHPFVTTKSRPGSGLGLAVAHGVMHAHGGDIAVRSKPDEGATFTLYLPIDASPVAPQETVKVLVVDDDPDFLEQHRIMLDATDFDVITAERSDEALEISGREIPDAFVLDMMMERPDSGARLARALRRDPRFRTAPIMILTSVVNDVGFEFHRNPAEVLDWMKADAWFDKPVPIAELANTIHRLLRERRRSPESTAASEREVSHPQ